MLCGFLSSIACRNASRLPVSASLNGRFPAELAHRRSSPRAELDGLLRNSANAPLSRIPRAAGVCMYTHLPAADGGREGARAVCSLSRAARQTRRSRSPAAWRPDGPGCTHTFHASYGHPATLRRPLNETGMRRKAWWLQCPEMHSARWSCPVTPKPQDWGAFV